MESVALKNENWASLEKELKKKTSLKTSLLGLELIEYRKLKYDERTIMQKCFILNVLYNYFDINPTKLIQQISDLCLAKFLDIYNNILQQNYILSLYVLFL